MRKVSSDIRALSTLDRQSLAATPYGLLPLTKSIVDLEFGDEHPRISPATETLSGVGQKLTYRGFNSGFPRETLY